MACFICLDDEPAPIQSGCCCRGASGLAHVACRAKAAEHANVPTSWWICRTCKQPFTGLMRTSLAQEMWARVKDLPEADGARLAAAHNLSQSLLAQQDFKQAETVTRPSPGGAVRPQVPTPSQEPGSDGQVAAAQLLPGRRAGSLAATLVTVTVQLELGSRSFGRVSG